MTISKILTSAIIAGATLTMLAGCATTASPTIITAEPTITAAPNVDKSAIEIPFSTIVDDGEIRLQEGNLVNLTGIEGNVSDWNGKSSNETTAVFVKGDSSTSPVKMPQLILYNAGSANITLENSVTGQAIKFKIVTDQNKTKTDTSIVIK